VPSVRYFLVFDLNGLLCSKPRNKDDKPLLRSGARELLDWLYGKADVLFWTSTRKHKALQMVDALMQDCRRFKLGRLDIPLDDYGFFYQDHCTVSKHRDNPDQPILMKDLTLRVFKKLPNATLRNVLLIDDSPDKNCPNYWSQAIHPPTFRPDVQFDDNYLLRTLFDWLKKLLASNMDVRKFVEKNPLPDGKSQLRKSDSRYVKLMASYSRRFQPADVDRAPEFQPKF
jgi:hypothetical protein